MRKSLFRIAKQAFPQCRRGFPAVSDGRFCKSEEPFLWLWRVVKAEKKVKSGAVEGAERGCGRLSGAFPFSVSRFTVVKIFYCENA